MSDAQNADIAPTYCEPHGEQHGDLECLRVLAEAASSGGQWSASLDSCGCGPACRHGSWVHGVHIEKTHSQGFRFTPCDPDDSLDAYAHLRTEMSEFSWDEAHYIVAAQPSVVLDLLDRLAAIEAVCAKHEYGALRWAHPLPVPSWIAEVREAATARRIPPEQQ